MLGYIGYYIYMDDLSDYVVMESKLVLFFVDDFKLKLGVVGSEVL